MRYARFAPVTFAIIVASAACSGTTTPAPSVGPSAAASGAPSGVASAAAGGAVSIVNFSFQPATMTIPVGATVTWTNNDTTDHTVTADDGSFTSDKLAAGATFSQSFATAGTFAYHCSIHASMKGTITVH